MEQTFLEVFWYVGYMLDTGIVAFLRMSVNLVVYCSAWLGCKEVSGGVVSAPRRLVF